MKKVFCSAITVLSFLCASAQKMNASKVPAAVKASFEKQYPGTPVTWEKENGQYEASFKDGANMSLMITPTGNITETEIDISKDALPADALAYLKAHYAGKNIKGAAKIVKPDGTVSYEANMGGKDVLFNGNGVFIKEAKD